MHGAATQRETGLAKIVDEIGEDSTNVVEHRGDKVRRCIGSVNIS